MVTTEEFFQGVEWEGGILEYVCEYGVNPEDFEDPQLRHLIRRLQYLYKSLAPVMSEIEGLRK